MLSGFSICVWQIQIIAGCRSDAALAIDATGRLQPKSMDLIPIDLSTKHTNLEAIESKLVSKDPPIASLESASTLGIRYKS
jgi:hypothetical protein